MHRLNIRNRTHMIEFPDTAAGMMQAKAFRKNNPAFKGRKIWFVFQCCPFAVPCGVILEKANYANHPTR